MQHEIYVELCEDAKNTVDDNKMCKVTHEHVWDQGRSSKLAKDVQETMATLGFSSGEASPALFCHHQRSFKCLVYGDDFAVSGEPVDLVWMRNEFESKLEINTTIRGDEPGMSKGGEKTE